MMAKDENLAEAGPAKRLSMTPEVARAVLEFMGRAQIPIHQSEAEAFLRVRMTLQAIAGGDADG